MRSNIRKSLCPSRFCSAANPSQNLVSKVQAEAVDEPALAGAITCSECGCVWVKDKRGVSHELGTLRRVGTRYQWKTSYRAPSA